MPKISYHSVINASKINVKENCENVNALSRKLHFCKNCYIWGKAIAGTAKIFPFIVRSINSLAEFRSVAKDTKSNTKNFTKSISIDSDYQSIHFY